MTHNIAIIQAEYNEELTNEMVQVAESQLKQLGATITNKIKVFGVLDMPLIALKLLEKENVDGLIVIGVVIKGDSDHDQLVANQATAILKDIELDVEKPIAFSIIGPGIDKEKASQRTERYAKHAAETIVQQIKNLESLK
tara:strand:+ start:6432 stop:6851 length:420 start_codon:yes stop_codon:yes gene_type:complete